MQPDDIQGLTVEGTGDRFDEWWELEHSEEDVDDVDFDVMDDNDE